MVNKRNYGVLSEGGLANMAYVFSKSEKHRFREKITYLPWPNVDGFEQTGSNEDTIHHDRSSVEAGYCAGEGQLPAKLLVQLDGSVYYEPQRETKHYIILFHEDTYLFCELDAGTSIMIYPGVLHTFPYLYGEDAQVDAYSRNTRGMSYVDTSIEVINNPFIVQIPKEAKKLSPEDFTEDSYPVLAVNTIEQEVFPLFKESIDDFRFQTTNEESIEYHVPARWPESRFDSRTQFITQEFTMEWKDEGARLNLFFKGLTGTLAGGEGFPGVFYDKDTKRISIGTLLRRVDGTFFIGCQSDDLCMLVCAPGPDGEPTESNMIARNFSRGVRLPVGYWHSVPFPFPSVDKLRLKEVISETNVNQNISIKEAIGKSLFVSF